MFLVELVAEGLSGYPSRFRLGFRGHLDVVCVASHDARSALVDVVYHTLYPDPGRADATRALLDEKASARRALLTLSGRDQVPYRVLRDLGTGTCRLYRFDREKGSHILLSESAREAEQFLRVQHQLPDDISYERLFLFAADARPSLGGAARNRSGEPIIPGLSDARASGPGLPRPRHPSTAAQPVEQPRNLTAVFPLPSVLGANVGVSMHNALVQQELELTGSLDLTPDTEDEALLERYRTLVLERSRARRAKKAEEAFDVLIEKEHAAERALRELQRAEAALERVDAAIEREHALHAVPGDLGERLLRHDDLEARYRAERDRLEAERLAARGAAEIAGRVPTDLHKNPWVSGGIVAAMAAALAALLLREPGLVLLQVGAGFAAGVGALRTLGRREGRFEAEAKVALLEDKLARTERQHLLDTAPVRGILAQLGTDDIPTLAARFDAFMGLVAERESLRAVVDGPIGQRGRRAGSILAKIAERKAACQEILEEQRGEIPAIDSLERRIAGVEAELRARGLDLPSEDDCGGLLIVQGTFDLPPVEGPPGALTRSQDATEPLSGPRWPAVSADDEDDEDGYRDGYGSAAGGGVSTSGRGETGSGGLFCLGGFAGLGGGPGGGAYGGGGDRDRASVLIEVAADLVGQELGGFTDAVLPRVRRITRALTGGEVGDLRLAGADRLELAGRQGWRSYRELEGALLDQVDAGLRFALLDAVLRVRPAPLLVEEPVAPLPPERRDVLRRIYAHFAHLTQVIVITPADDLGGHRVTLED